MSCAEQVALVTDGTTPPQEGPVARGWSGCTALGAHPRRLLQGRTCRCDPYPRPETFPWARSQPGVGESCPPVQHSRGQRCLGHAACSQPWRELQQLQPSASAISTSALASFLSPLTARVKGQSPSVLLAGLGVRAHPAAPLHSPAPRRLGATAQGGFSWGQDPASALPARRAVCQSLRAGNPGAGRNAREQSSAYGRPISGSSRARLQQICEHTRFPGKGSPCTPSRDASRSPARPCPLLAGSCPRGQAPGCAGSSRAVCPVPVFALCVATPAPAPCPRAASALSPTTALAQHSDHREPGVGTGQSWAVGTVGSHCQHEPPFSLPAAEYPGGHREQQLRGGSGASPLPPQILPAAAVSTLGGHGERSHRPECP